VAELVPHAFEMAAAGDGATAGTHFQEGVSSANLGSVHQAYGDHARAEGVFPARSTSTPSSCLPIM